MRDIYGSDSSISSSSNDQTQGPVNQNIVPSTSDIYDVGTVAKRFRNGVFKSCNVNGSDVDTRLSAIETKTQNQTSTSGQTNITGALGVYSVASQAVLGSQYGLYMGSLYFNYAMGYEFIPTADIVVSSFIVSTQAWQSSDSTKAMGIYRASDSALMGSATLTKTVLLSGYYGINCTPIKLSSGIKYVLSAQFVAFSDKYLEGAGVAVSFGAEISNVVGRSTLSASLIMPITTTGPNNACFGNFIYSLGSSVSASKFIVPSGLSTEFLKADGTVDNNTYLTSTALTSLNDKTYYQSKPSAFNTTFNSDIYPLQDNLFTLGFANKRWRYLFCSVSVEVPTIDQGTYGDTLRIGPANAGAVEIGRSAIQTNILGTTMINNAFTLPTVAPQVGQLLQCNTLGSSSWTTSTSCVSPFGAPLQQTGVSNFAGSAYSVQSFLMPESLDISSLIMNRSVLTSTTISVAIYNSSRAQLFTSTLTATTASTLIFPAGFGMTGGEYYYFAVFSTGAGFYAGTKPGASIVNSGLNASLQYTSFYVVSSVLPATLPTTGIVLTTIIQPPFTLVGY